MSLIESFVHKGKTIEIHQDPDVPNPRKEYDHVGKIYCFHKRYDLGDKHSYNSSEFRGWEQFKERLEKDFNIVAMLPVFMYDHSGITINTTGFSDSWDSGQVGWAFITREGMIEGWSWNRLSKNRRRILREAIVGEVEEYDQYLRGDVYGYVVKEQVSDAGEEEVDSCWGMFGLEYVRQQAIEAAQ